MFSEEETSRLKEAGLPVSDREDTLRRELALWSAVTAHDCVIFTCRTAGSDGTPRQPSLLIPIDVETRTIPLRQPSALQSAESAGEEIAVSAAQRLLREATSLGERARRRAPARFESIDPPTLRQAILAAYSEELRTGGLDVTPAVEGELPVSLRPHPWGGLLRDPVVIRHLADRFGETRTWSASQLEQYGRRPFDFLLDRVLRIRATDEAEEATSPASRGALAHEILDRFFRGLGAARPSELTGEAAELYEKVAEQTLGEAEGSEDVWLGEPALWQVTREQVVEIVRKFLARELPRLDKSGVWPVHLELAFGDDPEPEFRLEGQDLEGRDGVILVRGRIDRVDAMSGKQGLELQVLDYKWKSYPAAGGYADGSVLQMPIYMRAISARDDLEGVVTQGAYRPIDGKTAHGARLEAKDADGPLAFILSIPPRIRRGYFEAVQAKSTSIRPWQPGREITRTDAAFRTGHRFVDPATELDDA